MITANYNHGPFRSGAWHASKSEALDLFLSTSSWRSPDFQDIALELAKHWGTPLGSANDYEAVFAELAHPVFGRHMAHRYQRALGDEAPCSSLNEVRCCPMRLVTLWWTTQVLEHTPICLPHPIPSTRW